MHTNNYRSLGVFCFLLSDKRPNCANINATIVYKNFITRCHLNKDVFNLLSRWRRRVVLGWHIHINRLFFDKRSRNNEENQHDKSEPVSERAQRYKAPLESSTEDGTAAHTKFSKSDFQCRLPDDPDAQASSPQLAQRPAPDTDADSH